jgi:putative flippase GtrA
MKQVLRRIWNRETILYLVFGVLTTLVNFTVFEILNRALGEQYALVSETAAFIAAVLFAYFTNKPFVFQSRDWSAKTLAKEIPTFFGGRVFSFLIEAGLVLLSRDLLHAGKYDFLFHLGDTELMRINGLTVAKAPISVIVVILNYIFSKLLVFRNKE